MNPAFNHSKFINGGSKPIGLGGKNAINVIAHEERILEFSIVDTISQFQKAGKPHGGIIRPQLGWKTELIN